MVKVDLIIMGNLFIYNDLSIYGGGDIYVFSQIEDLDSSFDIGNAITIEGDISISSLDGKSNVIVVIGEVAEEGGNDE